ncbi:hypothetical protein E2562_009341 [Oryza meyeriana var. granulata]|uniref:Uncharacterized protein n=1 Tax=Oryza meyeriana var. granulata TaxID=110450 RepID=A0A6G1CDN9_9ORYZ|nr:hypothetical protein E2562_009341 [Oryza meyeriana var. granulata]
MGASRRCCRRRGSSPQRLRCGGGGRGCGEGLRVVKEGERQRVGVTGRESVWAGSSSGWGKQAMSRMWQPSSVRSSQTPRNPHATHSPSRSSATCSAVELALGLATHQLLPAAATGFASDGVCVAAGTAAGFVDVTVGFVAGFTTGTVASAWYVGEW